MITSISILFTTSRTDDNDVDQGVLKMSWFSAVDEEISLNIEDVPYSELIAFCTSN